MRSPNSLRAVLTEDWQEGGFGLYLHWPFCQAKCPYCDFNSHVSRTIDQSRWQAAYISEIDRYAAELPNRVLTSVFFGGGTPSLMQPELVAAVIERIRASWPVANELEITLEANPGSVEAGRFKAYAEAGVNRISMGIQALNNRDLQRLGRIHTVEEARNAFDIARTQFQRVSFDLIYARQDQDINHWKAELNEALSMAVDHLSLYQLTIEQGTAFGDRYSVGKLRGLPEDDAAADMYQVTQDLCGAAGMPAYEVSNHARQGAESRHNKIYWRYGDYIGIGPGAHGRITLNGQRTATDTVLSPQDWMKAAEAGNGDQSRFALSQDEQANEFLMMGLRLTEGLDPERYEKLAGGPLPAEKLRYLEEIGMITTSKSNVSVTDEGRMVLNSVIRELMRE